MTFSHEFLKAIREDLSMILKVLTKEASADEREAASALVTVWIGQVNRQIERTQ